MSLEEKAINLQNLREHNVDIITNLLSEKPMSCLELASKINISDVAVNKIIKQLRAINMVVQNVEITNKRKKGGQHIRYSLNPYIGIYICIDFTHNNDRVIVYNFSGEKIIDYYLKETLYVQTIEEIKRIIVELKEKVDKILPIYSNNILSLVLSIPGQVRPDNSILFSGKFKDFPERTLNDMFEEVFKCNIIIKNNVHFMALGEYEKGTLINKYNSATYLYLAYGIASCVLIDGKIVTGWEGYAGEIGGNFVYPNHTMSQLCSIIRLLEKAEPIIGKCSFEQFLEAYKSNPKIHELVIESAKVVASFIINASNLIGCNLFMISGDALKFGDEYIDTICNVVNRRCVNQTKVIVSTSNDSSFFGMMKTAKDYARINYYKTSILKLESEKNENK